MKKLLIISSLIFGLCSSAIAGDTTANGYFYLPSYGAYGTAERTSWYNSLVSTDAVIKILADYVAADTAGTATVANGLASNGTNCSAGEYPLGIDASGNAEGCATAAVTIGGINWTDGYVPDTSINWEIQVPLWEDNTALAANGANCSAGTFPLGVDASGAVEGCVAVAGTDIAGVFDLGALTSLELPNGATPTVDAFGEIAGDNNYYAAGRGAPIFYDGTAAVTLVGTLFSDTPTNGQVPQWNTGGTITWETPSAGATIGQYQVAFAPTANTIGGDAGMTYDAATNVLTVSGGVNAGATTGVTMTGSNGTLTFLGAGDGADEDLKLDLNGTANSAVLTSTTAADTIVGLASYSLGAAGVKLTGDGDGAVTLLGLGNGSDEDLTINLDDTSNTVSLSSTTGVTKIDPGTIVIRTAQPETRCMYWESPVATDDFKSIWYAKSAFTLTSIWAESDQTVTFMLQVDDGSPSDVDTVDLAPAAGTAEDTALDGDATMAAGDRLDMAVTSVANTPTWVSVCFTGTYD